MPAFRPALGALVSTFAATLAVAVLVSPLATEPDAPGPRDGFDGTSLSVPFVRTATAAGAAYLARTFAGSVCVQEDGAITYALSDGVVLRERPAGEARHAVRGGRAADTRVNVFRGPDPSAWRTGLRSFASVAIDGLAPGVRLDVAAGARNVEKRFHVAPGADVDAVRMRFDGRAELDLLPDGRLAVATGDGGMTFTAPVAFQDTPTGRRTVDARYVVDGNTYGFEVEGHDPALPLVIDPLIAGTYLGSDPASNGFPSDRCMAIAHYAKSVYVVGDTQGDIFPAHVDPQDRGYIDAYRGGPSDAFVCRLSQDLSILEAVTFLGGDSGDTAHGVAVDASGVWIVGRTQSTGFPVQMSPKPVQASTGGGTSDGFVTCLTHDLETLQAGTILGGDASDEVKEIELDPQLGVIVLGKTRSTDLGRHLDENAYEGINRGVNDAFVFRLTAALDAVVAGTLYGGRFSEDPGGLAVDGSDILICGSTSSSDLPLSLTAYDKVVDSEGDGFVARFDGALRNLKAATFLGGDDAEYPVDECLDVLAHGGHVVVCGVTASNDFPTTEGAYDTTPNDPGQYMSDDAFVVRLAADLSDVERATLLGGTSGDEAVRMIEHEDGLVLVGRTSSDDFAMPAGSEDTTRDGTSDGFLFVLNHDLDTALDGRYLGGELWEWANGLAMDGGTAFITGDTVSRDWADLQETGGFDPHFNDSLNRTDGYVISYGVFEGGGPPPPTEIDAYILPKRLDVKHKGAKSKLNAGGWFDSGSGEVDWSLPATLTIGDETFQIPGLTPEKKAKGWWGWSNESTFFRIKPSRYGSSKGKFKLKRSGAALEAIPLDEPLLVRFRNNDVDAVGEVTLKEGRYKLGRQRGALIQPRLALYSCKTTLKGDDKDGLRARLGIATDEGTPHECPPITIGLDDQFVDTLPSDVFDLRGRKFVFKGPKGGLSKATVDFGKEKLAIHGKKIDAGQYPEGPQAVEVLVQVGEDALLLKVRMVRDGKIMRY